MLNALRDTHAATAAKLGVMPDFMAAVAKH